MQNPRAARLRVGLTARADAVRAVQQKLLVVILELNRMDLERTDAAGNIADAIGDLNATIRAIEQEILEVNETLAASDTDDRRDDRLADKDMGQ